MIDVLTPFDKFVPFPLWDICNPFIVHIIFVYLVMQISKNKKLRYIVAS